MSSNGWRWTTSTGSRGWAGPSRRSRPASTRTQIHDAAFRIQQGIESGERVIVGVNRFVDAEERPVELQRVSDEDVRDADRPAAEAPRGSRSGRGVAGPRGRGARGPRDREPVAADEGGAAGAGDPRRGVRRAASASSASTGRRSSGVRLTTDAITSTRSRRGRRRPRRRRQGSTATSAKSGPPPEPQAASQTARRRRAASIPYVTTSDMPAHLRCRSPSADESVGVSSARWTSR